MKRIFTHLFVAVLLLSFFGTGNAWAQFENGNVYRIVCSGTNSVSLGATALSDVAAVSTSETDKSQQWYVTVNDGNYTFRNLGNGRYLLGNNGTSGEWGLTESSNNFTVSTVSGNYCIRGASHSNGYGYMHKDGGNNIVSWESNAANSQWTPYLVNYSEEELAAIWAAVDALVVPTTTVEGYNNKLAEMFTDGACTQLNSTYAAKTLAQIKSDANYTGLPAVLQAMVEKVYNEQVNNSATAWDEANAVEGNPQWDNDYAKRFRVQMYEPYSIEGEITSYLRFNAHCNMDNPTGIYANSGEPIYIMVDGDIADGAELWVAHQAGLGATNYYNNIAYTKLHKGLNVVPYFNDASTLWINYLVHTYDKNGNTVAEKFPHKISDYAPLKIHIEGGHINGYYNAIGDFRAGDKFGTENLWGAVDNDADWNYYKVRAPLNGDDAPNRDFPLLGHRQTLLFPLGQHPNANGGIEQGLLHHLDNITVPTAPYNNSGNFADYTNMGLDASNGKINIMIEAWDRIMYSELATMGLVSTSTMDKMNSLYPRWTSEGTAAEIYDYNGKSTLDNKTYKEFCQGIDYSEYFNHHGCGVGAPSGYMSGGWRVCNYHYNTMESIIGKIAAEAGPTWGPAHEIGHQHQGVFNLNGQTEVTNNFFSNVAVWYMGMGTSRVNGSEGSLASVLGAFNTDGNDLYTNNIWAITHLYYRLWLYYHLAGNNTQFWPRLFELCRQVPLENGGQISGETTLLRFYQHACDAAGEDLTEFFRAHGFFEIMDNRLVGDYSNAIYNVTQEQIDKAIAEIKAKNYPQNLSVIFVNDATSETTLKHDGKNSRSLWDSNPTAEFGSVNDFIDGDVEALTSYTATVSSDGTVTMSGGEGGIGFLVLNEKGEIVSFSNKSTFELNDEAVYLLATDKATVVSVDVESETANAEVDLTLMQKELLESFIADVEAMPIDDGSYRHVGFYTYASAVDLFAALANAKEILDAGDGGYAAAYELLYTEKEKLVNSANPSLVPFDPSLTYIITNYAYKDKTMYLSSGVRSNTGVDKTLNTSKWEFKTTGTDGVYNLYNVSGSYLAAASKSTLVSSVSDQASAATYSLIQDSPVGTWAISVSPAAEFATLHDNSHGNVVGWEAGAAASKWYLTAVEGSDNNLAKPAVDELNVLIAKTESLIDVVGIATPCRLQTTDAKAPFYLWCNANVTSGGDASMPAAGYNILDGDEETFLHTVYSGDSQDGLNHYLRLDMGEGNSLSEVQFSYKTRHNGDSKSHPKVIKVEGSNDLSTFEEIATISEDLPNDYRAVYTSAVLSKGKPYRYIRFMVTDTYADSKKTDGNGHKYFYIAEFSIPSLGNLYVKVDPEYDYVTTGAVTAAYNAVAAAKTAIEQNAPDFSDVKSTLQSAYEALYNEYNSPATDKITELQALINETKSLVAQAGTITNNPEETVALSTSNVYCNATIAEGELGNLFKDDTSFMHTQWNGKSADSDYHYLRVDMGEGQSIGEFYFTYTTASRSYQDMPKKIVVEGANEIDSDNSTKDTFTEIATLTAADDGLPQDIEKNSDYESRVLGSASTPYRYLRFRVTAIGRGANTGDIADDNGYPYFTMAKFGLTKTAYTTVTINDEYKNTLVTENLLVATNNKVLDAENMIKYTSSVELLTAQIATLQAAKEKLQAAMNEDVDNPIDKSELEELYETANALYATMANEHDEVNADYAPSALTNEMLAAAKRALDAAKAQLDDPTSQPDVDAAKAALLTEYNALLAVKEANKASSIDKQELTTLIDNVNALLSDIATEAIETTGAIPLQSTNAAGDFYITCNAPAGDSDGVAGLIDKNADGTGNTGTFLGTNWNSEVPAYTHYLEIDLGEELTIGELSMDYTTRNSTHANQRPNAIKILGSNDKDNYTVIAEITSDLPNAAVTKWTSEQYDLNTRYRYIRVAVGSEKGYFHMSDFNLYTTVFSHTLNDYYTTSGINLNALLIALDAANDVKNRFYLTQEQYDAAKNALNGYYEAVNEIKLLDCTNRTELETLVAKSEALVAEIADVNFEEQRLSLQCEDENAPYYIFCNAPEKSTTYPGDNLGVAALLDVDESGEPVTSTHLHTAYSVNDASDNLDHYLRVDMGEANLLSFKFAYISRSNTNNAPTEILIEGISDLEGGEWEEITTLTNLPAKAYSSGEITNGKTYRYIRFMVKATVNNDEHNGHPYFAMSHFEMTACKTVAMKEGTGVENAYADIVAAAVKQQQAETLLGHYALENDYNNALSELQAAYSAVVAMLKAPLKNLIDETTMLRNSLYEIAVSSYNRTEITLQNTNEDAAGYLYCNAPGNRNNYGDNGGVAALIDKKDDGKDNLDTYLHTPYDTSLDDNDADNLDHYLRVDLGVDGATEYVEFGYVNRSGYTKLTPSTVLVEATNDLTGKWTTIKTLTMAEPSITAETKTGALGNGVPYRYWRFMVTATHDTRECNGHPYFALSDFNVYKCTDVVLSSQLKSEYNPNIYIYATADLVDEVDAAIAAARAVYNDADATMDDCNSEKDALQAKYDKLAEAIELSWCPVALTTDVDNPALYTIDAIGRGNDQAWQYNVQNNNITIVNKDASNLYHLWYFMQGAQDKTVKIVPVMTPEYGLSATDFTNGVNKVSAVAESSVDWSFAYVNNNYNFKPHGRNIYLSNFNGGSNPLGFFGSADGGSYVSFSEVEVENYLYARLQKLIESYGSREIPVVENVVIGCYTPESAVVYNNVYSEVTEATVETATAEHFNALWDAYHALVLKMPVEGALYRIKSAYSNDDYANGAMMYVNATDNSPYFAKEADFELSNFIWSFETVDGGYRMKNLHTQTCVQEAAWGAHAKMNDAASVVKINILDDANGVVDIKLDGGYSLHAQNSGSKIVGYSAGLNTASAWYIEEVSNAEAIKHTVTMNATFSSVMLGYNAVVPAGVEAYNAEGVDDGYVVLAPVAAEGEVIPANTPVILYRTDENTSKTFKYTDADATNIPDATVLGGSLYQKFVKCDENTDYYKLMIKDGTAKMYWMFEEFAADGTYGENDALKGTNNGGYIKCSANKIYMALPQEVSAASFGMRFIDDETTNVIDLDSAQENDTIYDLQGRKLTEITQPGFYIVNGCKVYVK